MQRYKNNHNSLINMEKLEYYRKKINGIDKNMVKLLLARFDFARKIANCKKENKRKITDKKRESQVIKNIKNYSTKKHQKFIINIYKKIINYSKKLQR